MPGNKNDPERTLSSRRNNSLFAVTTAVLFLLVVITCTTDDTTNNSFENQILGEWRVFAVELDTLAELAPEDTIRVIFMETTVSGQASGLCGNHFSGQYSIQDEALQFTNLTSTEAACPASLYWTAYAIIERANSYVLLSDGTLVLCDQDSGDRLLLMTDD